MIPKQGKSLTGDQIIETVKNSEHHAKIVEHYERKVDAIVYRYVCIVLRCFPSSALTYFQATNARDDYETPDDKLNDDEDYIEIEDDSDTSASYAIVLGDEAMSFEEIEERIPRVESYSGVNYYPSGYPYRHRIQGEEV